MYHSQVNFATLVNRQKKAKNKLDLNYGLRYALAVMKSYMFKTAKQNRVKLHNIEIP
jgi:hypothetical protein